MTIEEKLQAVQQDIEVIKARNTRVEAEKAWEISMFRVIIIASITYGVAVFILHSLGVKDFFLNALIPTVGYILSTQSLPVIKKWWTKNYLKKKN
ncbi:MAG: hypothetical protein AAB400_00060 [Patescibacteria group bacterium]